VKQKVGHKILAVFSAIAWNILLACYSHPMRT